MIEIQKNINKKGGRPQFTIREGIVKVKFGIVQVQFAMTANCKAPQYIAERKSKNARYRVVPIIDQCVVVDCFISDDDMQANVSVINFKDDLPGQTPTELSLEGQMRMLEAAEVIAAGDKFAYPAPKRH